VSNPAFDIFTSGEVSSHCNYFNKVFSSEAEQIEAKFVEARGRDRDVLAKLKCRVDDALAQCEALSQREDFTSAECPAEERSKLEATINALRKLAEGVGDSLKSLTQRDTEEFRRLENEFRKAQADKDPAALALIRCKVDGLINDREDRDPTAPDLCPPFERQDAFRELSKKIGDSLKALNLPYTDPCNEGIVERQSPNAIVEVGAATIKRSAQDVLASLQAFGNKSLDPIAAIYHQASP